MIMTEESTTSAPHLVGLPIEVRQMIYRHLLVARFTAREHTMNSQEVSLFSFVAEACTNVPHIQYNLLRSTVQKGPDQTFQFYPAIMRVSRQIHQECVDVCRRENDFVCVTSKQPSALGKFIYDHELQTVAQCSKAHSFWNIAMTVTLDRSEGTDSPYRLEESWPCYHRDGWMNEQPCKFIFPSHELPRLCQFLAMINYLRGIDVYIDINKANWNGHCTEIDRCSAGLSRLRRLLEPLELLHGVHAAQVEGPLSSSSKRDVIKNLCRDQPRGLETLRTAMALLIQGDEINRRNDPFSASDLYKKALNYVYSCHWSRSWEWDEGDIVLDDGLFYGLKARQAMFNLQIRLLARIASIYLKARKLRMARIYTERAFGHPYDDRGWKQYELELHDSSEAEVFAEVFHVSAEIRYLHGNVERAVFDLHEAGKYLPLREEQQCRLEAWKEQSARLEERNKKRGEAATLQRQQKEKKFEGIWTLRIVLTFTGGLLTLSIF